MSKIAAERQRQIEAEGFDSERDDGYVMGALAVAAACYALHRVRDDARDDYFEVNGDTGIYKRVPWIWPWTSGWWKPTTRRRNLIKAGALIVAEIERLDRADVL